jgi:hypothetical protein
MHADSNDIKIFLPFVSEPVKIDNEGEELEQCITRVIGSRTGSNEVVNCEYISRYIVCIHFHHQKNNELP